MEEARKLIVAGDTSRAIQIYTKILQIPGHARHQEAQEYLALARRYLALYPDSDGTARVTQRLAALLAGDRQRSRAVGAAGPASNTRASRQSDWRLQTYFSQYYRRDANQLNDEDQVTSQSALYSDVNLDARRRGTRR
jgi:hypothetical protein